MVDILITERQSFSEDVRCWRASLADLNELVYVCRVCFPEYYRWRSFVPIGRKWWKVVLESEVSQTWVLEDINGVFAFDLLVLDTALWKEESKKRNGSFFFRILSVVCCPYPIVWKRLLKTTKMRFKSGRTEKKQASDSNNQTTAWVEMTAVLPRSRNQGWAIWLIQARGHRALQAGVSIIETRIDLDNVPSRRMADKAGYVLISEDPGGCLYRKYLKDDDRAHYNVSD